MIGRCQLGLSAETLSAWRAKALPAGKQNGIAAHVASCSACQATLAGFERVAQALRTLPTMPTQAAVWRGVQASISIANIRGTMTKSQKTLTLSGLGVAASLVAIVAIVFVLLNNHPGQTHPISVVGSPSPTATTLPSPTPTIDALKTPSPSQGWVTVPSLSFAKNMTFSASDPLTGYACGNVGSSASAPLELSITHDGGRTWQGPVITSVLGANCDVYINPIQPQDIVMVSKDCRDGCSGGSSQQSYRSLNGGQTWIQMLLPLDSNAGDLFSPPIWIGDAMYVADTPASNTPVSERPLHSILKNTNGSVLTPVTDTQLFDGISNSTIKVQNIWSNNNTLFVALGSGSISLIAKTSDNGTTWQKLKPTGAFPSFLLTPVNAAFNGTLLGGASQRVVISSDSGMTWQQLPQLPQGPGGGTDYGYSFDITTPSGVILLQAYSDIWELTQGSTIWKDIGPNTMENLRFLIAISTDKTGYPILAWSGSILQPGIAYHSLIPST